MPAAPEEATPEPASESLAPTVAVTVEAQDEVPEDTQPALTEEVAPAPEPDDGPKLSVGVGMRTGLTAIARDSNGKAGLTLDDGLVDQFNVRPYFSGQLNEHIGFTANFEIGSQTGLDFQVLDAILQLKLVDELQVWIGQHIPAMDRSNINGPFYHNSWNFPITVHTFPFDVAARDRGVTFWGLINGGMLKYHLSAVDLQKGQTIETARYSGRLTLHLLEPEDFYYNSGTYYGEKDILAIGAVGHYQKGTPGTDDTGAALDNDYRGFSLDAIFEKNFGAAGTFTVEGAYYQIDAGPDYIANQGTIDESLGVAGPLAGRSFMFAASWLTPTKIGIGKIQPNTRLQVGDYGSGPTTKTFDLGLAYVIDGFNHRWHLNYRHQDDGVAKIDMFQIGAQIQMWH